VNPVVVDVETDQGEVLQVATPKDPCGATRAEVARAYQQLTWTLVSSHRGEQTRLEAAVLADCDAWKDMVALEATPDRGPGTRGASPVLPPDRALRLCVYRSRYPTGWEPGDMSVVEGVPEGGAGLTPVAAAVSRMVEEAGRARPCTERHTRFAVITAADGEPPSLEPTYVELDGCLRVLAGDGTLRKGTTELVDLIEKAATS
jgi:hypothetical protein